MLSRNFRINGKVSVISKKFCSIFFCIYKGKFKRNKFHGKGKYTSKSGEVFEGKWRRGRFYQKVNKKARKVIVLTVESGMFEMYELKGVAEARNKWFHAEKIGSEILLTAKGKIDQEKAILKKEQEKQDSDDSGGGC